MKNRQSSIVNRKSEGFVFIPLIMALGGGAIGGAIGGGAIMGIGFSPMFGLTGTQIGGMLGMMAGSTLGNLLFPTPKEKTPWPEMNEYPMQKATNGPPIQKVLGTRVVAGNFVWEGDLHSYQVKHSAGGGKGGGEEAAAYETQYNQSFLVDLGEGPASVLRIWTGNKQIWPDRLGNKSPAITVFEGIDNQGIKDLTGEDYGEWPRNCCVFFSEWPLGNSPTKPQLTFEVGSGLNPYYVGTSYTTLITGGRPIVWKIRSDGSIDTNWGDAGKWHYEDNPYGGTIVANELYQLADGRLLVAHNPFWIEGGSLPSGKRVGCTMLTKDGDIDTSWGYNGHYVLRQTGADYSMSSILKILTDDDGNYYICGESGYEFQKFDANGTRIFATAPFQNLHDMCWADDDKTRIIAVGTAGNPPGAPTEVANCIALNPGDGSIDTDWPGNLMAHTGYAMIKHPASTTSVEANAIRRISDGFVILHGLGNSGNYLSLSKIDLDGTSFDTAWGTLGHVAAGWPNYKGRSLAQEDDRIWSLTELNAQDAPVGTDNSLRCWGERGQVLFSQDWVSNTTDPVHTFTLTAGSLLFGTKGSAYDQVEHRIEQWSRNGSYITGWDPADLTPVNIFTILPIADPEGIDMNFATMCREVLTDEQWGASFDAAARINETTFTATEDYCGAEGLVGSIILTEKKNWREWLDYICAHFGGFWYEATGQICLGVYKDETAIFNLSVANGDFVIEEGDNPPPPISVRDRDYSETYNRVIVSWIDREHKYAQGGPTQANDETDQRISGQVREKTYDLSGIMTAELAQRMAYRLLIEAMYRFKSYYFRVPYKHMLLEVGDVGTISDGDQIVSQKVRIFSISEYKNGKELEIVAIEDISDLYPTLSFGTQALLRAAQSPITLASGTISFREDIETNQLYLSIAPGAATTNGWYIYRSYDNSTYDLIGRCGIDGVTGGDANSTGTLESSLPAHPSPVWAPDETALVDIGTVTDLHTDITETQFWNNQRLAQIGDEIISFLDAEETATPGVWQISWLRRGLFGTEAVAHSADETFRTLDIDFLYRFSESDVGKTLYFKAVTFYGDDSQALTDVTAASVVIQGYASRPAAASLLRLTADLNDGGSGIYSGATFTLYWNLGSRVSGFNYGDWVNLPWNNYIADAELQAVVLKFEEPDGTPIGQREITVGESATITKATDLGGLNPAVVKVVPRRVLESRKESKLTVDDGS